MRILHIVSNLRRLGNGGVYAAVDLACLQSKLGHQVAILSGEGEYEDLIKACGVQHFRGTHSKEFRKYMTFLKECHSATNQFKPDIVHVHTMIAATAAWASRVLKKYKMVSTVHNEFQKSAVLMGLADRVITVSKAGSQTMENRGISKRKIRTVLNGTIDSPRTRPLTSYESAQLHHPAIVSVGGMHIRKGHIELIQAFDKISSKYPNTHLYLVGDGPERGVIESAAKQMSAVERIHFEGFQSEPQSYLLASDIFVLASHRDPCPLVIAEAREAGCAIIASDVDGIPELLDNGHAGMLVPAKDSSALADSLEKLLADANTLLVWQEKAKENVQWLSAERVVQETLLLYQELLDS